MTPQRWIPALLAGGAILVATSVIADPIQIDFEGFAVGEVIAGEEPQGGTNPGTAIPGIILSVQNLGGGPHSLLVFDSANPSGDDLDLGTPNESCGGPGVGGGGTVGQPGENCVPLGKILIIAENLIDNDNDNLVDDPDDEAGGGRITLTFTEPVIFVSCTFIDIEELGGSVQLWDGPNLVADLPIEALGNNSAQTVGYEQFQNVTEVVIEMTGSGAVGEFLYDIVTPVEPASWGAIKSLLQQQP